MESGQQRKVAPPEADTALAEEEAEQLVRNRRAVDLLTEFLDEDDGYDRQIWPLMEQELPGLRTRIGN